jgi:hypothetical protein
MYALTASNLGSEMNGGSPSKMVTVILSLGFVYGATWISNRRRRQRPTMHTTARLARRSDGGKIKLRDLVPHLDDCISPGGVEKLENLGSQRKLGDRKCLSDPQIACRAS